MNIESLADEVHKPIRKVKQYRKVISNYKNNIWAVDLVDMQEFSDINKNYKYILTVMDLYTRYAWAIPLKTKTGLEVSKAFKQIFDKMDDYPDKIYCDEGKEFYNKNLDELRGKYSIEIYSTYGVSKASPIERFNRSLKELMFKQFTINGNRIWYNMLADLLQFYNNRKHKGINGEKPKDVYDNDKIINGNFNIVDDQKSVNPKFKVNDRVRISYKRGVFDKGYYPNWSWEIYKIKEVLNTNPITYKIEDSNKETIKGSFYTNELQKTNQKDNVYLIEKVLDEKIVKGQKKYLVKWLGYPESQNSWIDEKDWKYLKDMNKL